MSKGARRWRWALMAAMVVAFGGLIMVTVFCAGSKVTLERYSRIQHAMARDDVVKILGTPTSTTAARGYVKGPDSFVLTYGSMPELGPQVEFPVYLWETGDLHIGIMFSPENRVVTQNCTVKPSGRRSWRDRIVGWLRKTRLW